MRKSRFYLRLPEVEPGKYRKWRDAVHRKIDQDGTGLAFPSDWRLSVAARIYLPKTRWHVIDVDNCLKALMDALQGAVTGHGKKRARQPIVIPNDNQVYKVEIAKAPAGTKKIGGRVIARRIPGSTARPVEGRARKDLVLTYQVRPRVFRVTQGEPLAFPATCMVRFHFQPPQPFGTLAGGGRTAVRAVPATAHFNANSGVNTVESKVPLSPLTVTIQEPTVTVTLAGTTLSLSRHCASPRELGELIEGVYFVLPALLNASFADPPYIERVDGYVGSTAFRWELAEWHGRFDITTQERQEAAFASAWKRMALIGGAGRRRVLAALHYFHVACRLAREACVAGEFIAEVILNLAKSLEVLFPPTGDRATRDAARQGLRGYGFSDKEIECNFLPAMALRNEIDVGHVELGLFTMDQLRVIHGFTERAESAFRDLFQRLLARIEAGEDNVEPYQLGPPRQSALAVIERLRHCPDDPAR